MVVASVHTVKRGIQDAYNIAGKVKVGSAHLVRVSFSMRKTAWSEPLMGDDSDG